MLPEDHWPRIADKLETSTGAAGFEVKFVWVAGGDRVLSVAKVPSGGCATSIVTDVSRAVDFFPEARGEAPAPLLGHGPWEKVAVGRHQRQHQRRDKQEDHPASSKAFSRQQFTTITNTDTALPTSTRDVWGSKRGDYALRFVARNGTTPT